MRPARYGNAINSPYYFMEKEAIDLDDDVTAEVYALLGGISSLRLDLDSEEQPICTNV